MRKLLLSVGLAVGCLGLPGVAAADDFPLFPPKDKTPLTGQPRFVSTAEVIIGSQRVVFFGVDPAMEGMPCTADGRSWDCGSAAKRILLNFVGREALNCEPQAVDLFRRVFAKCTVHGKDVAMELIEQGMAVALPQETKDYVEAEKAAKAKKVGMWRGPFKTPDEYRKMMSADPRPR